VLDGMLTVTTGRIQLNDPCAAAMRPCVKLLYYSLLMLASGIKVPRSETDGVHSLACLLTHNILALIRWNQSVFETENLSGKSCCIHLANIE